MCDRRVLGDEQSALRRVATLVARGAAPDEVFAAVTEEVARLLAVGFARVNRHESDHTVTCVASSGSAAGVIPVGSRQSVEGENLSSQVETPIIVEDRPWGFLSVTSTLKQPLPADAEERLTEFAELVATAIANAEGRAALARLAEEQAALRRVATLVARGASPEDVFAAVTEEVGQLLPVDLVGLGRYEPDRSETIVASWGLAVELFPVGLRLSLGGENLVTTVFDTGRPARKDSYADASGSVGVTARNSGFRSAVGTPIIVEGRVWGVVIAGSSRKQPLPSDTEARLASFTELVGMAIANAESRAALAASRARIVAAADETRRRIERDLHDGTQQQLVSLMLRLRAADMDPSESGELRAQLARTEQGLAGVLDELREISRGIHPAILSKGGLGPTLKALAHRSAVPVELELRAERRLPQQVEVAVYYVVSEALTNAAKHSHASVVQVELDTGDHVVRLAIRDDGIGGADPRTGSGLLGLSDRIEAFGGTLRINSPTGGGTSLQIEIPLENDRTAPMP